MIAIGLTGSFGSGCTKIIAEKYLVSKYDFKFYSLSKTLAQIYDIENKPQKFFDLKRKEKQSFGNIIREQHGKDYLAKKLYENIIAELGGNNKQNIVVDSIRNPFELRYLKESLANFYLIGVYADFGIRWDRVEKIYDGNINEFKEDDKRDKGEDLSYGQRVKDTFNLSDFIINNNENFISNGCKAETDLSGKLSYFIDLINGKIIFKPSINETNMTLAYSVSLRSNCLKRKVGAVIADDKGMIISSGYNRVPEVLGDCKKEFNMCYRSHLRENVKNILDEEKEIKPETKNKINSIIGKFKMLDYCRALHAEESAILDIIRHGNNTIVGSKMYVTTYPCNLCANSIVTVGISKLIYFEPYPMEEAKKIITAHGIETTPFEGITHNGYFKFMEEIINENMSEM